MKLKEYKKLGYDIKKIYKEE